MWASNKVFPKSVRFTLSQRMETAALDVLECLIEANEIFPRSAAETAERLDLQKRALTKCKLLLNLLDIALERGLHRHPPLRGLDEEDTRRQEPHSFVAEKGCSAVQPERLTAFHWGIPCTASTFVVRSALPERVELEQRPQRELGRDAQQQQRVQRQQRRPPGFGGIYRDQVDPAAAGPKAEAHPSKEGISRPKAYRRG